MPPKSNLYVCVFSLVPLCLRPDLVLAGHDDVLRSCGGLVRLDLQRVSLAARVAVRGEEAVVLLHAQGGPGQLSSGEIHRQRLPSEDTRAHRHTLISHPPSRDVDEAHVHVRGVTADLRIKQSLVVQNSAHETGRESEERVKKRKFEAKENAAAGFLRES